MDKDFDGWNKNKKRVDAGETRLYTVREVWWCRLGVNVGTEQDGKGEKYVRPCIIIRSFGRDACLVAPLTTSEREHPLRVAVGLVQGNLAKANISQLRVIDTRRLLKKIAFLDKKEFEELKKRIRELF